MRGEDKLVWVFLNFFFFILVAFYFLQSFVSSTYSSIYSYDLSLLCHQLMRNRNIHCGKEGEIEEKEEIFSLFTSALIVFCFSMQHNHWNNDLNLIQLSDKVENLFSSSIFVISSYDDVVCVSSYKKFLCCFIFSLLKGTKINGNNGNISIWSNVFLVQN